MDTLVPILSRYLHIVPAMLVVGGLVIMRLVLPAALERSDLSSEARDAVFRRCRKAFKIIIHTSILLLLLTGTYNSIRLFPQYKTNPAVLHALWGSHILLGLVVFGVSIYLLKGDAPPASHRSLSALTLLLLLLLVLLASSLKQLRERYNPATIPPRATAPS
jgi:uncharacterized membrane protein